MDTVYFSVRKIKGGFVVDTSIDGEQVVTSLSKVVKLLREALQDKDEVPSVE